MNKEDIFNVIKRYQIDIFHFAFIKSFKTVVLSIKTIKNHAEVIKKNMLFGVNKITFIR